jgi:hypothetical protein
MAWGMDTALRNSRLDALTAYSGAGAKLRIYDGARPATGGAVTTLLGEFVFPGNIAPAAVAGVLTMNTPPSVLGLANSTATWARIVTSADAFVADMSAGTIGTDVILNIAVITVGMPLVFVSGIITEGNP